MSQSDVIAFLGSAAGHPGGGPVDIVETHGALIFLAGDVALKIKREVTYDYMDLSTLALREAMLRRELELNKPVAPKIYQDVVAVTRTPDGALAFDGLGQPVEWVLRMWRFPAEDELAVIADKYGIDDTLAHDLGEAVHRFHAQAPLREAKGAKLISDILDELDRVFVDMHDVFGKDRIDAFATASRAEWHRMSSALDHRAKDGHVRRCHGDLHLRNLVMLDGVPVPFDALEFDEVLGICDVLYDLAFLLMDLHQRGLDRAANIVLSAYLLSAGGAEDDGLSTLPLFLAVRAAISAMVMVQTSTATHHAPGKQPVQFLESALALLARPCPKLILLGGLSGTGKTTIARALVPLIGAVPGAVHLRTDLERKEAMGIEETAQAPNASYSRTARHTVYARVFSRAEAVLSAGHSVLIDATFLDPHDRDSAAKLGARTGVKVSSLWLDAPLDVLIERVSARAGDASDADATVVRAQHASLNAPSDWAKVSALGGPEDVVARVCAELGLNQNPTP
ncbi:MAG: AAA family ATPase [Pseudomonadota bacterium]